MTIILQKPKTNRRYTGLSVDTKPILTLADIGDEFFETDAENLWVWYGTSWKIPTTVTEIPPIEIGAQAGQATRVDFITDNLLYRGEAPAGTADAASGWRIRKITIGAVDGDVIETWADGNSNYDNVWDNRLSYTYT